MITFKQLKEICPLLDDLDAFHICKHLDSCAQKYSVDTPLRICHFLAQVLHESMSFKYRKEVWGPTDAQANYDTHKRLGNKKPGDGKKYMGRGYIQITGLANYEAVAKDLKLDCVTHPELLETIPAAVLTAFWYWEKHGLNSLADKNDIVAITKKINGGLNGFDDRAQKLALCRRVLFGPLF